MRVVPAVTEGMVAFLAITSSARLAAAEQEPTPAAIQTAAGESLPVLQSTRPVVSVQEGSTLRRDAWRLAPEVSPDVYEAALADGGPLTVTFLTDVDRISFTVEVGSHHDFIIQHGGDRCLTRIVGVRVVPAAVFDAAYRAAHAGEISVEVPEVYELVNVALALTPTGLADRALFYHDSAYYQAMRAWFEPHRGHPVLAALEEALEHGPGYQRLKMNGYAFVFDNNGRLVQSPVYDRTSFSGERTNGLRPFIEGLQSFAEASGFRAFYAQNQATYIAQIDFYSKVADVKAMRAWLNRNFPDAAGYDSYKILFSPLVAYNQSATWMESNGFKELQAHVNYPYPEDVPRRVQGVALSPEAAALLRSDIVFTELNHGYINPEADRYAERVNAAISRRDHWVDPARGTDYYGGISTFNEYMNWALVSLRVADLVPAGEQQTLIACVDRMMTQNRGFPRFAAFDAFLLDLYRHRQPDETVADLYPQIIAWLEKENAERP